VSGPLLEVARQARRLGVRPERGLRFAFWGAEEAGLLTVLAHQFADVVRDPELDDAPLLARLFPECRLYDFDTFSGFPADGREDWQLDFATHALPRVPERVELVVGRFEETLAPFLERKGTFPLRMVHVDCDIFSAASTALFGLGERLGPGSVIVFDELLNYGEFADNELLAFYLFLVARGLSFECGCFGKAGAGTIGAKKVAENLVMLAIGMIGTVDRR